MWEEEGKRDVQAGQGRARKGYLRWSTNRERDLFELQTTKRMSYIFTQFVILAELALAIKLVSSKVFSQHVRSPFRVNEERSRSGLGDH